LGYCNIANVYVETCFMCHPVGPLTAEADTQDNIVSASRVTDGEVTQVSTSSLRHVVPGNASRVSVT